MRIRYKNDIYPQLLDYCRRPGMHRVRVIGLANIERLEDLYFVRARSWRMIWNYLREVGPIEVVRKVRSRRKEQIRNDKFLSVGFGTVIESGDPERLNTGQLVVILLPRHPEWVERAVLPDELILPTSAEAVPDVPPGRSLHLSTDAQALPQSDTWTNVRGWSPDSGDTIKNSTELLSSANTLVQSLDWSRATSLSLGSPSRIRERKDSEAKVNEGLPRATLIGFGNYAKTVLLPGLKPYLSVDRIHEVDPTQIPFNDQVVWDTAPAPRSHDVYDALLIAGFHHTHAPLAVEALSQGRYAVVEKPIATSKQQADNLIGAVQQEPRLFACFHKRYLPFNEFAFEDLDVARDEPISYHCIVYEVPLPRLHWYRWPNSKSRLVSNGCHWIDHFLFLNGYRRVEQFDIAIGPRGTVNCSVRLENGAYFTMVLTDRGSERTGVQEYIELRANQATIRMSNGNRYEAENSGRVLRRKRINKISSYRNMYESIGRKIGRGEPGDSLMSVAVSTELIVAMDAELCAMQNRALPD